MEVFGNEAGEKWRAQYNLNGQIWKRELPSVMKLFCDDGPTAADRY